MESSGVTELLSSEAEVASSGVRAGGVRAGGVRVGGAQTRMCLRQTNGG